MDGRRRKRLERAGWKLGSVREFLNLSDEEVEYIELKLALAAALRARRISRKLTQAEASKLLHSSQSRVARMEAGDRSVSLDLLVRSLLAMGASRRDLARTFSAKSRRVA
jgi:hypothetical protein